MVSLKSTKMEYKERRKKESPRKVQRWKARKEERKRTVTYGEMVKINKEKRKEERR